MRIDFPRGSTVKARSSHLPAFLRSFGLPFNLVALHPESGRIEVESAEDEAALAANMKAMKERNAMGFNIYFEPNAGAIGSRSSSKDVVLLRAVYGDVDAKNGKTLDECYAAVRNLPIEPSFTVRTGGGLQVFYCIDYELMSPASKVLHGTVGKALRDALDGDAVFDPARMMRMPGFLNHPCKRKQSQGRSVEKATICGATGVRHNLHGLAKRLVPESLDVLPAGSAKNINADLMGGLSKDFWFDRLSVQDQHDCLQAMLAVPGVVALADTSDASSAPNWRTVLAACARSGVSGAYDLCRNWAATSRRFEPDDFDRRWRSYTRD